MDGLLLVKKPKEWTSFDVVAKVRGIARQATGQKKVKVGHAGTLDPLATGLLLVLVGNYCKRASEFSKLDKCYEVTMEFGKTSTTDDEEGEKTFVSDMQPADDRVKATLQSFVGSIEQIPPIYSAIKVDGKRAYKSARQGQDVTLKPRIVTIHSITDVTYNYPNLSFITDVSSGTYIRSLARDIGSKLGTGAYLKELNRKSVGQYLLNDAISVDAINEDNIQTKLLQV